MRDFTDGLRTFFKFVIRNEISLLENACKMRSVLVGPQTSIFPEELHKWWTA